MKSWRERNVDARERGYYTDEEKALSGALGGSFHGAVMEDDFNEVDKYLDLIEDRALEIKRRLMDRDNG